LSFLLLKFYSTLQYIFNILNTTYKLSRVRATVLGKRGAAPLY